MIGVSATTKKEELYAAEVELRIGIVDRRAFRRARRNRKTRRRQPLASATASVQSIRAGLLHL
jgi:hypothetical protein